MRLVRPELKARHRGVRPVFWLLLILGLVSPMVLVGVWRELFPHDPVVVVRVPVAPQPAGQAASLAHCNPVQVTTFLASTDLGPGPSGAALRAACLALAGKIGAARQVILDMAPEHRGVAVHRVFLAGHPVADAGDDTSAGPIMELVVEFQPDQFMALYHAGIAAAIAGHDARARRHLTRFLEIYRSPDSWTQNARRALSALELPRAERTVEQGGEGSIIY